MKVTSNKILCITVFLLVIILSLSSNEFLSIENIYDMVNNYAILMILACGLFVVLVSGGIDISFPAITIISQYIAISFISTYEVGFLSLFIVSIIVGIFLGFINSIIIYKANVPSIIITISTLNIFYGALLYFSKGIWLYDFPHWFTNEYILFKTNSNDGFEYGLSFQSIIAIFSVLLTYIVMYKTNIGRTIYALGGNKDAASRMGFRLFRLYLFVYGYMGLMASLAGVVQAYTLQSVAPDSLLGYELVVLAAVVLGGASLSGGKGSLFGIVLGVILLAVIQNGLILLRIDSYWQMVITGIIIILSISITSWSQYKYGGKRA